MKYLKPPLLALASALLLPVAGAQSYTSTYAISSAMDKGIAVRSCQNDMTIVEGLAPVRLIAVTLPDLLQNERDGNNALLMTTSNTGRIPVSIFYEDDTYARLVITSCKTTGANNLIRLVDGRPTAQGAAQYTAQPVTVPRTVATTTSTYNPSSVALGFTTPANSLNSSANYAGAILTLPAPSTVTMNGTLNDAGLVLSVKNGSAQTLRLDTQKLRVTSGQLTVSAGQEQKSIAPGQQTSVTVPLSADQKLGPLSATWTVDVPALRVNFPLTAQIQE